jgi:hypothetical protein
MAPTHLYFQPQPLEKHTGVSAAMFRGRGLLAKQEGNPVTAALLAVDSNNSGQLQVKAEISNLIEWHHAHLPETLQFEEGSGRIRHAQEWSEVADIVSFDCWLPFIPGPSRIINLILLFVFAPFSYTQAFPSTPQ